MVIKCIKNCLTEHGVSFEYDGTTQAIFQIEKVEEHLHFILRKVAFSHHSPVNWDYPTQQKWQRCWHSGRSELLPGLCLYPPGKDRVHQRPLGGVVQCLYNIQQERKETKWKSILNNNLKLPEVRQISVGFLCIININTKQTLKLMNSGDKWQGPLIKSIYFGCLTQRQGCTHTYRASVIKQFPNIVSGNVTFRSTSL